MKRVHLAFLCGSALGLAVVVACSSDDAGTKPTAGTDSGTGTEAGSSSGDGGGSSSGDSGSESDTGASDTGADAPAACLQLPDAGASCNTLTNDATSVAIVQAGVATPTGTGGTIADGRYFLTDLQGYTGNLLGALTLKQVLVTCAGVGQLVSDEATQNHKTFTYAPAGTAPNIVTKCSTQVPDQDIPYASYTATPTTLTLYSTTYAFSVTYTKQP